VQQQRRAIEKTTSLARCVRGKIIIIKNLRRDARPVSDLYIYIYIILYNTIFCRGNDYGPTHLISVQGGTSPLYIYRVYYIIIIITQYYNLTVRTHRPSCSSCIFVQTNIYIGKRIVRSKRGSPVYSKDFGDGTLIQHLHTAGRKIKTVHPPPREH